MQQIDLTSGRELNCVTNGLQRGVDSTTLKPGQCEHVISLSEIRAGIEHQPQILDHVGKPLK